MTHNHSNGTESACCDPRHGGVQPRPRLVIGVFNDAKNANGVAERLRGRGSSNVNVLSSAVPVPAQDIDHLPGLSLMECGHLYQQIAAQLRSGASVVVVDAHSPEQQLGISRVLLDSKCDMLLTHDGSSQAAD